MRNLMKRLRVFRSRSEGFAARGCSGSCHAIRVRRAVSRSELVSDVITTPRGALSFRRQTIEENETVLFAMPPKG
jgi:hypothetical protein